MAEASRRTNTLTYSWPSYHWVFTETQVAWSTLQGTEGSVSVYRQTDGADSPGGTFTLAFNGEVSQALPWNASAASLEQALEFLHGVGDVAVTATHPTGFISNDENSSTAAATWLVEFTTVGMPANIGDLPLLESDGSFLTGTATSVTVEEISAGCCVVEVSANGGVDYTSAGSDSTGHRSAIVNAFRYQDRATVRSVTPSAGPTSGGTAVFVLGTGFDLPSAWTSPETDMGSGDFVCVFGGRLESPASRINSTTVTCTSPFILRRESGAMSVTVRWPGSVSLSTSTAAFTYYEDVTLQALTPRRGSNVGGIATAVSIGQGSFSTMGVVDVTCHIEVRLPSNLTGGYATFNFSAPAIVELSSTPLEWDSGTVVAVAPERIGTKEEKYSCEIPGLEPFFPGVSVEDWVNDDWGTIALVSLSGNGGADRTAPLTFTYFPRPSVVSCLPGLGADGGGTPVVVHGMWFAPPEGGYDESELLCRFGHAAPVSARYISNTALACTTPPHSNVAAIVSAVVESAWVFHATQEILLRIPSPMGGQPNASSYYSGSGTWTLSLEDFETYPIGSNVTSDEMAVALSALPNIGNVTVIAEYRSVPDPYAGLSWNETSFMVYFADRGGDLPILSANTQDLRVKSSGEIAVDGFAEAVFGFPLLAPEVVSRVVQIGHDGDGIAREVQVLRTNRPELSAEVQTLTVATGLSPTAEVSSLFGGPFSVAEMYDKSTYRYINIFRYSIVFARKIGRS